MTADVWVTLAAMVGLAFLVLFALILGWLLTHGHLRSETGPQVVLRAVDYAARAAFGVVLVMWTAFLPAPWNLLSGALLIAAGVALLVRAYRHQMRRAAARERDAAIRYWRPADLLPEEDSP